MPQIHLHNNQAQKQYTLICHWSSHIHKSGTFQHTANEYHIEILRNFSFPKNNSTFIPIDIQGTPETWRWALLIVNKTWKNPYYQTSSSAHHLHISNGNFNLNTRLNCDGCYLLYNFWWAVQINNSLVHPQFKSIPSVGTWTQTAHQKHLSNPLCVLNPQSWCKEQPWFWSIYQKVHKSVQKQKTIKIVESYLPHKETCEWLCATPW